MAESHIGAAIGRLLGKQVMTLQGVTGGRNSQVYRVTFTSGAPVLAKCYLRPDRMEAEFGALSFLWDQGIRVIPQPLAMDCEVRCAVFQFIAGRIIRPDEVTPADIDAMVAFLQTLQQVSNDRGRDILPLASEACLCVRDIFSNIESRLARLERLSRDGEPYRQLHLFLEKEFRPELAAAWQWSRTRLDNERAWSTTLDKKKTVLSPSDFGFHNTLRVKDGKLIFLDFEHFGWDDPAKTASDFLLHPHEVMAFGEDLKHRFLSCLLACLDPAGIWLGERLRNVLPLYGLKWCTILLNEFVPADFERRRFAHREESSREELLMCQIQKARAMMARSRQARNLFPYANLR